MRKKQIYEAPEAEVLEVRFEDCILSDGTTKGFDTENDNIFNYNPERP